MEDFYFGKFLFLETLYFDVRKIQNKFFEKNLAAYLFEVCHFPRNIKYTFMDKVIWLNGRKKNKFSLGKKPFRFSINFDLLKRKLILTLKNKNVH